MNKKLKQCIIIVIGILAIVFGLSRLNIQSVSDFEREGEELSSRLQLDELAENEQENGAASDTAIKSVKEKKDKVKTQKPENTKSAVQTELPAQTKRPKTASGKVKNKTAEKKKPAVHTTAVPSPTATITPEKNTISCTIEIRVDSLNKRRDTLEPSLLAYVPENGTLLAKTKVTVKKNTTVYQVLAQVCKAKEIVLDAEYTPMYGSYYVRGIGHLYEQDAGDMSGWLYMVNGLAPDVGASDYELSDGDAVLWGYTCDGRSV